MKPDNFAPVADAPAADAVDFDRFQEALPASLHTSGWAIVDSERALALLDDRPRQSAEWHTFESREANSAQDGRFSSVFGPNPFPWHSDCAHWRVPPRYLAL